MQGNGWTGTPRRLDTGRQDKREKTCGGVILGRNPEERSFRRMVVLLLSGERVRLRWGVEQPLEQGGFGHERPGRGKGAACGGVAVVVVVCGREWYVQTACGEYRRSLSLHHDWRPTGRPGSLLVMLSHSRKLIAPCATRDPLSHSTREDCNPEHWHSRTVPQTPASAR